VIDLATDSALLRRFAAELADPRMPSAPALDRHAPAAECGCGATYFTASGG